MTDAPASRRTLGGGRYEVLSRLGEGSIGVVYRARHTGLDTIVALKVLHESFQRDAAFSRRFHGEALAMSKLDHPNVIQVHDFGQEPGGLLYISMPFVDGISVRQLQQQHQSGFELARIVSIMLQVCAGLGHAHSRGLIHRDVKPDNVMLVTTLNDDGERVETVKLLDFGFAVPPSVSGEVAQRLAGTPVYMSPEQCRGEELDARSDIYACGIMLYELATGIVPFLSENVPAIQRMHIDMPVPSIAAKRPDIDPRYERIVQRALAKSREGRHASMLELRTELKALLGPSAADRVSIVPGPPPNARIKTGEPSLIPSPVMSPSLLPLPQRPPSNAPPPEEWLEHSRSSYASFITGTGTSTAVADLLARNPSVWLGELARERDARAFVRRIDELQAAVRLLAGRGDAKTLQRVSVVIAGLADRPFADEAAEAARTEAARLFSDPEILGAVAKRLLLGAEDRDAANDLITRARVAGAIALYSARTRFADAREVPTAMLQRARVAFVTTMRSLGASALPVVKQALERLFDQATSGQHRAASELAEDVLLSVPKVDDAATGTLIVKYAGHASGSPKGGTGSPNLCRAAARALPRVWGARARPVLIQLVPHADDGVCLAALAGLVELNSIETDVVVRIGVQIDAGRAKSPQVQSAFATALQAASPQARVAAKSALARLGRVLE